MGGGRFPADLKTHQIKIIEFVMEDLANYGKTMKLMLNVSFYGFWFNDRSTGNMKLHSSKSGELNE